MSAEVTWTKVAGIGQWSTLVGKRVSFELWEPWDSSGPWPYEGTLERVEPVEGGDPRYPALYVWGDWGGRLLWSDEVVEVVIEP